MLLSVLGSLWLPNTQSRQSIGSDRAEGAWKLYRQNYPSAHECTVSCVRSDFGFPGHAGCSGAQRHEKHFSHGHNDEASQSILNGNHKGSWITALFSTIEWEYRYCWCRFRTRPRPDTLLLLQLKREFARTWGQVPRFSVHSEIFSGKSRSCFQTCVRFACFEIGHGSWESRTVHSPSSTQTRMSWTLNEEILFDDSWHASLPGSFSFTMPLCHKTKGSKEYWTCCWTRYREHETTWRYRLIMLRIRPFRTPPPTSSRNEKYVCRVSNPFLRMGFSLISCWAVKFCSRYLTNFRLFSGSWMS